MAIPPQDQFSVSLNLLETALKTDQEMLFQRPYTSKIFRGTCSHFPLGPSDFAARHIVPPNTFPLAMGLLRACYMYMVCIIV